MGPKSSAAASVARRKILRLVGSRLLFLQPDQEARLAGFRVPEAAQELALRRRRDQLELVGDELVRAVSGQRGQPAVRVEHRRQREHLGDRLGVGDADAPDPILDGLRARPGVRGVIERPTGTTSSTTPIPPSFDSTVW